MVWATLEGFFWLPRTLMDIERLSYAYYDEPELIHAINQDLLDLTSASSGRCARPACRRS